SGDVISFEDYLNLPDTKGRVRVINLCHSSRYLSPGYYCSLLAEAREHNILPSLKVINDLSRRALYQLQLADITEQLRRLGHESGEKSIRFRSIFGEASDPRLSALARGLFERFPCPILDVELQHKEDGWHLKKLKMLSLSELKQEAEQDQFAKALDHFSRKIWRKPSARKQARYDLAILVDPEEAMPPSDTKALKRFIKAAAKVGIEAELIGRRDLLRLPEFDALFIRKTTAIDDYTYRFAKKAESEGLVVIDDPASIMRCCNKIYLADLLKRHKIPAPKTEILSTYSEQRLEEVVKELGFPIVLKIPDGSFSRGMAKVDDMEGLRQHSRELLKQSALVLAQEFLYTEYDWRIGVLNQKPLYACRYYMAKKHWQIYKHGDGKVKTGGFDTLPTFEVPKAVLQVAMKASRLIGDGLYGIDIKQTGNRAVVIEVNDNPSIESGVEDVYLGEELYLQVMQEFLRRLEMRGRQA
ncbi:MAG TPA: RimK family protein, partial [Motiliproteus sp.]